MNTYLKRLIAEHNLEHISKSLREAATVGFRLVKQPSRDDFSGTSRLGGLPDVPDNFIWPRRHDHPLGHLAQINCAELTADDFGGVFPESGLLHFFYDIQEQPWGFDPKHKGGAVVIYSPSGPLEVASPPSDLAAEGRLGVRSLLPAVPVRFSPFLSLPSYGSAAWNSLGLAADDSDAYGELCEALGGNASSGQPRHQLLGHANNIQGDMQLECQLRSPNDPKGKRGKRGAADWRLLLQFDSDDDLNIMWGDGGMVYFWIRDADLRKRDFKHTWTILQCS